MICVKRPSKPGERWPLIYRPSDPYAECLTPSALINHVSYESLKMLYSFFVHLIDILDHRHPHDGSGKSGGVSNRCEALSQGKTFARSNRKTLWNSPCGCEVGLVTTGSAAERSEDQNVSDGFRLSKSQLPRRSDD